MPDFETLRLTLEGAVARIELNRPEKVNAMNATMWREIVTAFDWLDATPEARVGVLGAQGRHFSSGIDFELLMTIQMEIKQLPEGRRQERLRQIIMELQDTANAIERCRKPVLAAVHGICLGGGIDLITACDMRYASARTRFSVKEIDLAIVADTGTLQRLPALVGEGLARELAFTGRNFNAEEAHAIGLVNKVFPNGDDLQAGVMALASTIASKSPLAVRGIKETLNYSRDHSVSEGLNFVATLNAAILLSDDIQEALSAQMEKRTAEFDD